jgi:type II secretory pathway pseudopilin PulG
MNKRAIVEASVLGVLGLALLASLIPALKYAQAEKRDGQRIDDAAFTKHALELYFNRHATYPLSALNSQLRYVITSKDTSGKGATGWYIETLLEHPLPADQGFDAEAGRNFYYRVVRRDAHWYYQICGGVEVCGGT